MKLRVKQPTRPPDRRETLRKEIIAVLSEETMTAREISERVGIQERDVIDHLEHIRTALHGRLVVTPAVCMGCGFTFTKRERLKGPGRCPVCRGEHIAEPSFEVR